MHGPTKISPKSWLAFDLNVLRRMKFAIGARCRLPPNPALGAYLKRWNVRVAANDPLQSAWTRSVAHILNIRRRFLPTKSMSFSKTLMCPVIVCKIQALTALVHRDGRVVVRQCPAKYRQARDARGARDRLEHCHGSRAIM